MDSSSTVWQRQYLAYRSQTDAHSSSYFLSCVMVDSTLGLFVRLSDLSSTITGTRRATLSNTTSCQSSPSRCTLIYSTSISQVAVTLGWLARCVRGSGRPREAEGLLRRALTIMEAKLDPDDVQVTTLTLTPTLTLTLTHFDEKPCSSVVTLCQLCECAGEPLLGWYIAASNSRA